MSSEKRKQKRVSANLFVELQSAEEQELGRGVMVDVSLSGFAVETEVDLKVNDKLNCFIEVPLKFKAVVVRTLMEGQMKTYGLRFVGHGFLDKFILRKALSGKLETRRLK